MEKTLIIIIMLIVLLSFTGCGGNEKLYGIYDVSSGKETTIGETKKNNMVISIPAGAFEQDVKITIDKVANNTEAYSNGKAVFLTEPFEIKAEGIENVRLNKPVTISMKLDRKNLPDNNTFDQYVMSYWTGDKWENIIPDPVKLSEGYLVFETWHFSSYSGKKMTDEEQVKEYARYLAMNDLAIQNTNPTLEKKIMAVVDDYLNGLSIYDKEARKQISDRVMNSSVVDIAVFASDHGLTTAQLGHKLTELIVQSTVDVCAENPLVLESVSSALDTVGDIAEASLALYDGDYKKAAGELTVFGATILGYGGVGAVKSLVDLGAAVVEQGIMGWKDYELECAYKAYYGLAKENTYGYKLNKGDWEALMIQMRGYYNRLVSERKDAYKSISGKSKLTDEEEAMIERQVESDLRKKFEERAKIDSKIDAKQKEYEEIIKAFKDVGLLTRTENGFNKDMTIEQRLDSLSRIRKIILDTVDGDISKFGSKKDREENIAWAIRMWIAYGKDRAKFYSWMREQGYLEKLKEVTGYWKQINVVDKHAEKGNINDGSYSSTWTYGRGTYTYRSELLTHYSYYSSNHDSCKGEYVTSTGTISPPKAKYNGGEKVVLSMKITAQTSAHICLNLGATIGARITAINQGNPFISYGSDISLYDIDEKFTRSYLQTYKNDTNTGYIGQEAKYGAIMPNGYTNGDRVYIVIGMGAGNDKMETAYEYEWFAKK